jgi:hypothetical protein
MWDALAKYQPYADQDGHGDSWRRMCSERTTDAADAAVWAVEHERPDWRWPVRAADSAWSALNILVSGLPELTDIAQQHADRAICTIEQALKERNHE